MSIPPPSQEPLRRLQLLSQPASHAALQSDAELLELYVVGGDQRAIETLIERYGGMVASVCRLTVTDPASAEDAFQATFLVLLKSAKKIRKQASLAAWLHGVAYRTACRIRSRHRRLLQTDMPTQLDESPEPASPPHDPIHELARKMELEVLDRELERLPVKLRAPLIEHYLLGHSATQIAERMELSVAAVEGRLRRGRRSLRRSLAQRGISLSVALAGAHWFQQHVHAAEATTWVNDFVTNNLASAGTPVQSIAPEVSSLVKEETNMLFHLAYAKSIAPIVVLAIGATWATLYNGLPLGSSTSDAGASSTVQDDDSLTLRALPVTGNDHVVAQMGMGGMGGGMGGMAGGEVVQVGADGEPVIWEKPSDESVPSWLAGGHASMEAIEANRASLAKQTEVEFNGTPLRQAIQSLQDDLGVSLALNQAELDLNGIDQDISVNLTAKGSLREILRRMCEPLDLTYVISESAIEITTKDDADSRPNIRFYDLSYVLPNSANVGAVVTTIENTINPDSWVANGGTSTTAVVGSMLIISTYDTAHQEIEMLLLNISKMNPKNAAQAVKLQGLYIPQGGMGGGMGGMGGGMGGMGGGGMGGGMF